MRKFFVYIYTWSDGHYYIGRSNDSANRFMKTDKYKDQFVYKYMINAPYRGEILYSDNNPFIVAAVEHELIKAYILDNNYNLNAAAENEWITHIGTAIEKENRTPEYYYEQLAGYVQWKGQAEKIDIEQCHNVIRTLRGEENE